MLRALDTNKKKISIAIEKSKTSLKNEILTLTNDKFMEQELFQLKELYCNRYKMIIPEDLNLINFFRENRKELSILLQENNIPISKNLFENLYNSKNIIILNYNNESSLDNNSIHNIIWRNPHRKR